MGTRRITGSKPIEDFITKYKFPTKEELVAYGKGGATRSKTNTRYDLIVPEAAQAEANTYFIGAEIHGEGNWKHGDKQFVKQLFNHLHAHINDILVPGTNKNETVYRNIGAIRWAAGAILWYSMNKREIYLQALMELHDGLVETKHEDKSQR